MDDVYATSYSTMENANSTFSDVIHPTRNSLLRLNEHLREY